MNRFLKYILFFLLGFIIYLLLNNKLIEGFENELTLLFSILKERTDIGCNNYYCENDHEINPNSYWEKKIKYEDENSLLCNNSTEYSIVSLLNSGNKCNNELCCDDNSCEKRFFSNGHSCLGRDKYRNRPCSRNHENDEDCFHVCCGTLQSGSHKFIFDNIKAFRDAVYQNTIQEIGESTGRSSTSGRCGTSDEYDIIFSEINDGTITGLDLRNFIYFSLLDLDHIRDNVPNLSDISTTIDLINYHDFECIHEYITTLYNEIISLNGGQSNEEKIVNIKTSLLTSNIFIDNSKLKIKEELLGDKTVDEYIGQLNDQNQSNTIFSERIVGGAFSKNQIQNGFLNFVKFYTNDSSNDEIQHNTHEDLIKDLKLVLLIIANPLVNNSEGKTPLDILVGSRSNSYRNKQLDDTDLKYIM